MFDVPNFFLLPSSFFVFFVPIPDGTLRERGSFNPYSSSEKKGSI
jgi:hypothetical protein